MKDSHDDEYVSMHHRIRRSLRRRLKHVSAESEKPVTDIVNEAIEHWLERNGGGYTDEHKDPMPASLKDRIVWLRDRKDAGDFYVSVALLAKPDLVSILAVLGQRVDQRISIDRLVGMLVRSL